MTSESPAEADVFTMLRNPTLLGLLNRLDALLPQVKEVALGNAVQELLECKLKSQRRPRYIVSLRQYLAQFIRGREHVSISAITTADIEQWFEDRREASSSRASNLGRLSALFALAYRRGYVSRNVCDLVERVTIERKPPLILTVDQTAMLLKKVLLKWPKWIPYLSLSLFAGVRPEELSRLSWSAIDLGRGLLEIGESVSKIHLRRVIDLPVNCIAWLRLGGRLPVPLQARKRLLAKCCKVLGFDAWPQDCLRHTAASYMLALSQDAARTAMQLGNSAKILLRHYWQVVSKETAQRFFALGPKCC